MMRRKHLGERRQIGSSAVQHADRATRWCNVFTTTELEATVEAPAAMPAGEATPSTDTATSTTSLDPETIVEASEKAPAEDSAVSDAADQGTILEGSAPE